MYFKWKRLSWLQTLVEYSEKLNGSIATQAFPPVNFAKVLIMGSVSDGKENPREMDAKTYLDKNRILDMFDNMTSMLIYARPDEPRTYLIQQLEKLKIAKQSGMYYPCLFDDSNLNSIFGMLDPTKNGYISREQFVAALSTIGITGFDEYPPGSEANRITLDTFLREAKQGLSKASSTFRQ